MNHHLNLFRFYNENSSLEFLENNLSRALSLTILNSTLFFNELIKHIVTNDDYQYLFSHLSEESSFSLDIQIDIDNIKNESFKRVYAVALTSNRNIDFSDFHQLLATSQKNITDIVITIKDIVFIIEVKRWGEDCKQQLFNQIYPFKQCENNDSVDVVPICLTWHKVVTIMETAKNIEKLVGNVSPFLQDFLKLAEVRHPYWFEPKPFNSLAFSEKGASRHYLEQRMRQALKDCKYDLLDYIDRLGLAVPFGWASEIIPGFHHYEKENIKDYIAFYIWPGNTKTQGYHIYNKSMSWLNKTTLLIDDKDYELEINYNIKISHFNKYVTGLNFNLSDLTKPTHTSENFYNQSGKWNINSWDKFEIFLDEHFKSDYDWRTKCNWNKYMINTDRTYFTMSLGFEVSVFIPYKEFCDIDKKDEDVKNVTAKINSISEAFRNLIK